MNVAAQQPRTIIICLEEILSSSYILTILFCSVLFGFGITILTLHFNDSRVFDQHGKQLPGPLTNLYGKNFSSVLSTARKEKRVSLAICEILLNEVGDGNIVASNNIFGKTTAIVGHPEMVKSVLSGNHLKFIKTNNYNRLKFFLGEGLLSSSGSRWEAHRNMINPGLQADALSHMLPTFDKQARKLLKHWQANIRRRASSQHGIKSIRVDLNTDVNNLVMSVLCYTGFGYDFQSSPDREVMSHAFECITHELDQRINDPTDWWWRLFPTRIATTKAATTFLTDLVEGVISSRLELFRRHRNRSYVFTTNQALHNSLRSPSHDEAEHERGRDKDILDALIRCSDGLGDDARLSRSELRDHLFTFLAAGHESLSSCLLWTIYELCMHPDVQSECQREVDDITLVHGIRQQYLSYEDVNRLPYLVTVLKETMRLHPTNGTLVRQCQTECSLGQYKLKPGSIVMVSMYAVHRHPEFWTDPLSFKPERFSRENIRNTIRHPYQYVPFSVGPRSCIGKRFALMELLTALGAMLSMFDFSLTEEDRLAIKTEEYMTTLPKNFNVTVSLRS